MAIESYQCIHCFRTHSVEKDFKNRIKRATLDPEFDNPNNPEATIYFCNYCQQELLPKTIKSISNITEGNSAKASKSSAIAKMNLAKEPENAEMLNTLGILYVVNGAYTDALATLNKAKEIDPLSASNYFYIAIALLQGKSPRLAGKKQIELAVENIKMAIEFEEDDSRKSIYYCLYLYIQSEFYESRGFITNPSVKDLIYKIREIGFDKNEIDDLFKILKTIKPRVFI